MSLTNVLEPAADPAALDPLAYILPDILDGLDPLNDDDL